MRQDLELREGYHGFVLPFLNRRGLAEFHSHPELEFNLVTRGSAWYIVGSRRYLLAPGTIIWLFPDQEHLLVDVDSGFRMWIAVLSRDRCDSLAAQEPFSALGHGQPGTVHVGRLHNTDTESLAGLCRGLTGETDHETALETESERIRFNHGVEYLFLEAWAAYESGAELEAGADLSPVVAAALRRVANAGGAARLSETAADLSVSESWLSRAFHRETGVRFSDYCNRIRLLRFDELRDAHPGANVSALALDAGFGSYAQFYRVYRDAHGSGPRARTGE